MPSNTIVNLVGHSLGGETALQIAGNVKHKINLLITVDPVLNVYPAQSPEYPLNSKKIGDSQTDRDIWQKRAAVEMKAIRPNTKTWANVLAKPNPESRNFSDLVADNGHRLGELPISPERLADFFVSTPENHSNFSSMMNCYAVENGSDLQSLLFGKELFKCTSPYKR